MKIAFFVSDASLRAGTERAVNEAARSLSAYHDVKVVSMAFTQGRQAYDYPIEVIDDKTTIPFSRGHQVKEAADKFKDHTIIITSPMMLPYIRRGFIYWEHRVTQTLSGRLRQNITRRLNKMKHVVVLNERSRSWFESRGRPATIINNIVHEDFYNGPASGRDVMWMGRLSKEKQVQHYINIAAQIDDRTFHVLGTGPESERVSKSKSVTLHGSVVDVPEYLDKCEFLVLTSRNESWSYSVAEAQARGVYPISFDLDGPQQLIQNREQGLLVPQGDTKSIVETINCMEPEKYKLMEKAQDYRGDVVVQDWLEILSS